MFFSPGSIWLYYDYNETLCGSPIDKHFSKMVIFYFIISILLLLVNLNSCCNRCECLNATTAFFYVFCKIGIGIAMLVFIQSDYPGNWESNVCGNLKGLALFWLIWNYFIVCVSAILGIGFIIFYTCEYCDYCCSCDYCCNCCDYCCDCFCDCDCCYYCCDCC